MQADFLHLFYGNYPTVALTGNVHEFTFKFDI